MSAMLTGEDLLGAVRDAEGRRCMRWWSSSVISSRQVGSSSIGVHAPLTCCLSPSWTNPRNPQGETLGDLGQFQHARLEPVVVDQPHLVLVVVVAGE
ncbi:hypothetical protein [Amycolatopsis sp. lyj-346]|uniref:hypothetical protein n=1 Tax=Amycolatopsis sp. lyj-346 TaxID=2789289 RepID=UPI00397D7DEA